jgi:hypothetical protein
MDVLDGNHFWEYLLNQAKLTDSFSDFLLGEIAPEIEPAARCSEHRLGLFRDDDCDSS